MAVQRLGPYKLQEVVGRGGMGTVYQAIDSTQGITVAVKALAPAYSGDEHFRRRFESEIDTLIGLDHPNIVRILSYGQEEGNLYFAMEYVAGNSLFEKQKGGHTFSWQEVIGFARQIAAGLRHAHDRGIIHRDLKPGNLLLSEEPAEQEPSDQGLVKITDFGIAKSFGNAHVTQEGNIVGTVNFMSPEQARGQVATAKSDLYSLGVVMYTLLAGQPPFSGKSVEEALDAIIKQPVPRLDRLRTGVPTAVADLVQHLLCKKPDERISTALALIHRIDYLLEELKSEAQAKTQIIDRLDGERSSEEESVEISIADDVPHDLTVQEQPSGKAPVIGETTPDRSSIGQSDSQGNAGQEKGSPSDPPLNNSANEPSNGTVKQPDYFNPVTDHVRKRLDSSEEPPAIHGRIWPTALMLVATLGLIVVGIYFALIKRPSAGALLDVIDGEPRSQLYQIEEEMSNFVQWYPNHERVPEVREWIELANAQQQIRQMKIRERLGALTSPEQRLLEILEERDLDPAATQTALQDFVNVYQASLQESEQAQLLKVAETMIKDIETELAEIKREKVQTIENAVNQAKQLMTADPLKAEKILQSVVRLYAEDESVQGELKAARRQLQSLREREPLEHKDQSPAPSSKSGEPEQEKNNPDEPSEHESATGSGSNALSQSFAPAPECHLGNPAIIRPTGDRHPTTT